MNAQGKGKISWTDYSWNPIIGCERDCFYCYGKGMNSRFKWIPEWTKPKFISKQLNAPLKIKNPSKIFVCSISDFFGAGVEQEWRNKVYEVIRKCPQHVFQILTKCPDNMTCDDFDQMPKNVWLGITITEGEYPAYLYQTLADLEENIKFVSIEPLLGEVDFMKDQFYPKPDWIIVGAMTGVSSEKYKPEFEWIVKILEYANRFDIPVHLKDNVLKHYPKLRDRKEFPKRRSYGEKV